MTAEAAASPDGDGRMTTGSGDGWVDDGPGPLAGIRVIDVSTSFAGPTATMYMADLGATVIKVERLDGDEARRWGPPFVGDWSPWFASANRNKRSIALDLASEAGRVVLERLIATADVFVESFVPTKLTRLQLEPERLCGRYPGLVYCAISAFGLTGPDAGLPGYDLIAQARSGLMSVTGAQGSTPQRVSAPLSDVVTGMAAAFGVSAALVRRRESGQGDVVDVSLLDSDLALLAPRFASYVAGEPEPAPSGGTDSVLSVYQTFETADRPVVIAVGNDGIWRRLCGAIGLDAWTDDPGMATNGSRRERRDAILSELQRRLVRRPAAKWISDLRAVGVPVSLVNRFSDVVADPHVRERKTFVTLGGDAGDLVGVRSPVRLRSMPGLQSAWVPRLAEHTVEVLLECGLQRHEITEALERGVVLDGSTGRDRPGAGIYRAWLDPPGHQKQVGS